ncbi:hypothetical protein ACJMK2_007949 [Sinanodonta woodiana]|uniref:Centrosomal protein of 104 kDa n=1 Tax=Sinanodonta woodiana TaxID=1069815 RepID=A0ABD3VK18_SINWO
MPIKLPYRVVHASGQDDAHRVSELNYHSPLTKGWQSSRYCLYPQDIVIQLDNRSRLRKVQVLSHQFLIATKVEFFVGDVPDGVTVTLDNARYTRLGYVSLSDNEKTGFKARELKSVQVDAVGVFLKLNIHKNHINKFNLYNQVGIIAVNVIGEPVRSPMDHLNDMNFYDDGKKKRAIEDDPSLEGLFNRPDYISPLDDLAFDMYQDPEVAQLIRRLEKKKQEAVLQERYDYAKKLKHTIQELQKVGEKLGKYEVEKRQAIEDEDYDKAKLKKVQMDEYRLQVYKDLNVNGLLETTGSRHPQPVFLESVRQPTPPRLMELSETPSPPRSSPLPRTPYDDRPLPAIRNPQKTPSLPPPVIPHEERPLPIHTPQKTPSLPPPVIPHEERITGEPEPMSEKEMREASSAIDVFGEPLVSKAYSKTWSYREDALLAVYKQMQELSTSTSKDDAKNMMRASIFLIKRAIEDKVYAVFKAALNLLKMILTEYNHKHKIPRQDTTFVVERTLPSLFHKSGDTAQRNRDDAKSFIVEMANFPEVKPTHVVPHECVKPFKLTMGQRLAQSRCEIVEMLYKEFKLTSGLTLDSVMHFNTNALEHNNNQVREVAERMIKQLYKDEGPEIKEYLPADDEKTRKITLWRQLFEHFDKVDGKPSKTIIKKQKAEEEAKKQAEIETLQKQLKTLKDMASGKQPIDESIVNEQPKKSTRKADNKPKLKQLQPKQPPAKGEEDEASVYNIDNICIFCGERNESFTEEGLDLHYWKNCPMLKRCANCKQVVEIASYTEHLLSECESKATYSRCSRCTEAIPKSEYDQHVADKACNAAKPSMNHCPLCHQNISAGEDGWKDHLMGKDGCKQNPRRLLALNKQPPQGGKTTTTTANRGKTKPLAKKKAK